MSQAINSVSWYRTNMEFPPPPKLGFKRIFNARLWLWTYELQPADENRSLIWCFVDETWKDLEEHEVEKDILPRIGYKRIYCTTQRKWIYYKATIPTHKDGTQRKDVLWNHVEEKWNIWSPRPIPGTKRTYSKELRIWTRKNLPIPRPPSSFFINYSHDWNHIKENWFFRVTSLQIDIAKCFDRSFQVGLRKRNLRSILTNITEERNVIFETLRNTENIFKFWKDWFVLLLFHKFQLDSEDFILSYAHNE